MYWAVSNDTGLTWGRTEAMIPSPDTLPLWGPVVYSTVRPAHLLFHVPRSRLVCSLQLYSCRGGHDHSLQMQSSLLSGGSTMRCGLLRWPAPLQQHCHDIFPMCCSYLVMQCECWDFASEENALRRPVMGPWECCEESAWHLHAALVGILCADFMCRLHRMTQCMRGTPNHMQHASCRQRGALVGHLGGTCSTARLQTMERPGAMPR